MEVGQQNKSEIGFIIQARLQSSRMPGKVLLPIPINSESSILQRIIDELRCSSFSHSITIATTTNIEDDEIVSFCENSQVEVFRGSEEDVLGRFTSIIKQNSFDAIVRLTGDNPIVDFHLMDILINHHLNNHNDHTFSLGLPVGMNFEVINPKRLLELSGKDLSASDKEHVTIALKRDESLKREGVRLYHDEVIGALRLTLDYPADYLVLSQVIAAAEVFDKKGIELVNEVFSNYPWIFDVNKSCIQKNQHMESELSLEFSAATEILDQFDFKRVSQFLSHHKDDI